MLTALRPSSSSDMTATAPVFVAPIATPAPHELITLAHRRLQIQLVPLTASDYCPERLVSAIAEFCRARRSFGASPSQVLQECAILAALQLDAPGVRLVEVLARQSIACPVVERLDRRD
jgi:hypothetical protein